MGRNSKIQWTDHTFNPWWGCVKVGPGCDNCYAERQAHRFGEDVWGIDKSRRKQSYQYWAKPYAWNNKAKKAGEVHRVFAGSMCDVFEDNDDLVEERERLYQTIVQTQNLEWLLLTKRPHNISRLWHWCIPQNVRLGTSVESVFQAQRVDQLLRQGSGARGFFVSIEPMLDPPWIPEDPRRVDWVIIGGESGLNARPFNIAAARRIIQLCKSFDIPVFMKQMGTAWAYENSDSGHKGELMEEWPEDMRVQEFPIPVQRLRSLRYSLL